VAKINCKPEISDIKLSTIKPAPYNPREISNEALTGLRHSLEKFGYVDLLVVNKRTMRIISGHQRYKILQQEGVEKVTAILVDVDEVQEQAMNVTLNNQEIAGVWTAALIPLLEKLRKEAGDDYIALRLKNLRDSVGDMGVENLGDGKTLPDDIPEAPEEPITKKGDLWILGEHRLLCGDATSETDVTKLMDGKKASLLATDPPYLVDYTGMGRPKGHHGAGGKDWSGIYHEIDIKDAEGFLRGFLSCGLKIIGLNTPIYIWHASARIVLIRQICDELNILVHQQIVWVKPCAVLSFAYYPWRHEPCLLCWQKGHKPSYRPLDKQVGTVWMIDFLRSGDPAKPEYHSDVWELDWEGKKRNPGLMHPTVKPTEVFAIPMRVHTSPGDICYEPFSGSGSQIIAAERLTRRCFAMEIEPIFCDVAVKRWEEFSGKKAYKEKVHG
jgi:DNA modification methylase